MYAELLARAADHGDDEVLGLFHREYRRIRPRLAILLLERDAQAPLDVLTREFPHREVGVALQEALRIRLGEAAFRYRARVLRAHHDERLRGGVIDVVCARYSHRARDGREYPL